MPPGRRRKYCRKQEKGKTRAVTNVYCLKRGMLSSSVSVTIHTRQYIYEWTHARARILVLFHQTIYVACDRSKATSHPGNRRMLRLFTRIELKCVT